MAMPLEGVRVLELGVFLQGPFCASMLGDLGAEVIKIEQPLVGDPQRGTTRLSGVPTELKGGRNFVFEKNNRSKKSITLDLKKEEGRQIAYKLVERSDVFIQNFRLGVMAKLGMDYQTLSRINPRLIYANGCSFGPKGPDSGLPSVDFAVQARAGIMTTLGEPGMPPVRTQSGIADEVGALLLAYCIVVALYARERLGVGQEVYGSLLAGMIHLQWVAISQQLLTGIPYRRQERARAINPVHNLYECSDGKWIALCMMQSDRYWPDLCKVLGIDDLEKDPRFENMIEREKNCEELVSIMDKVFAKKTRAEWLAALSKGRDFVYSPVNTISDLCSDPQVLANDYIVDFDHPVFGQIKQGGILAQFSKTPGSIRSVAPELGQHTEEVLTQVLGYGWDEIVRLREEGVI